MHIAEDVASRLEQYAPRTASWWAAWSSQERALPADPDDLLHAFVQHVLTDERYTGCEPRLIGSAICCAAIALTDARAS